MKIVRVAHYAVNRRIQCIVVCHYQETDYERKRMEDDCIVTQTAGLMGSATRFAMRLQFPMSIYVNLGENTASSRANLTNDNNLRQVRGNFG